MRFISASYLFYFQYGDIGSYNLGVSILAIALEIHKRLYRAFTGLPLELGSMRRKGKSLENYI